MRVKGKLSTTSIEFSRHTHNSIFTTRPHNLNHSTTVYLLHPPPSLSSTPWIFAASTTNNNLSQPQVIHPLTGKPQFYWNLPRNFDLSKLNLSTLAVSHHNSATSHFDKLLAVPSNVPNLSNSALFVLYDGGKLRGCPPRYDGGDDEWIQLSCGGGYGYGVDRFDDIITFKSNIYVLDREGKVRIVNNKKNLGKISIGKTLIKSPVIPGNGWFGWRKRFVVDGNSLYLVVRTAVGLFRVYKMTKRGKTNYWMKIYKFCDGQVLFMARDYYFFRLAEAGRFPGVEFENCIVFSEGAFPQYGKDCWEFTYIVRKLGSVRKSEDDIGVFRLSDGSFASLGGNSTKFPDINWSPPSWIFRACSSSVSVGAFVSNSESGRESEEKGLDLNSRDKKDHGKEIIEIDSDSDSQDQEVEKLQCDSNRQEKDNDEMQSNPNIVDEDMQSNPNVVGEEMDSNPNVVNEEMHSNPNIVDEDMHSNPNVVDEEMDSSPNVVNEEMHSNPNIVDVASLQEEESPSLSGPESESRSETRPDTPDTVKVSLSAAEEEVTKTLLSMNGGIHTSDEGTSRKNTSQSVSNPFAFAATESHNGDSATAEFEGFTIRSDLVATLRRIWQRHGNIIENCIMRSGDIIARALESLATMVQILEDNSAQSLSDCQADFLNSTLSDLRCICFKVSWLSPFVDKAVLLHKSKPLVDSLNDLSQSRSHLNESLAIVLEELAKLDEEEKKLKDEMAKVSQMIPFSGQVKFDEPLGLGLT